MAVRVGSLAIVMALLIGLGAMAWVRSTAYTQGMPQSACWRNICQEGTAADCRWWVSAPAPCE
mgnify:CR=1 FL=1